MIGRFARFAARTFFREIIIEGQENLPSTGPVLLTPNHPNGLLDPMLLFFLSPPYRLRFVAKAPLFRIPVFGSILRTIGAIPVVRKFEAGGEVDYSPFFANCVEALAENGSIVIFPEGRSLPQAYLAPLKTGPARIFLLARERGIPATIVPVGLNYEQGTTFRSRVLVCIAPPLARTDLSARELTDELNNSLQNHVVQAETYQERELMMLLEKISNESKEEDFLERFSRWKNFEHGLKRLRVSAAKDIDRLRSLLSRYNRLSQQYGVDLENRPKETGIDTVLLGAVAALPGWILNFLPYHLCDLLIRLTRKDAADTATFKVIYSLFLFPLFYFGEGFLVKHYFGGLAALLFALLILPASYFTLFYLEWYEQRGMFTRKPQQRAMQHLARLRNRILEQLNVLASRLD